MSKVTRRARSSVGRREAAAGTSALDQFDWYAFVCVGCGEETFVGRQSGQSVEEFARTMSWLYGDPPICSCCLHPDVVA
ncbi:MAG: hypothetical protein ACLP1Q_14775 [Solirubrobacteraceae bacterium]